MVAGVERPDMLGDAWGTLQQNCRFLHTQIQCITFQQLAELQRMPELRILPGMLRYGKLQTQDKHSGQWRSQKVPPVVFLVIHTIS